MKKRTKNIIIVAVVIILFNAVCLTGYYFLNKHLDGVDYRGVMADCVEYIENDNQFKEEYGTPVKFVEHENKKIQKHKEGNSVIGLLVSFYVEVDSGEFYQVTMRTYKETDEWKIDYYEVKKVRQENVKNG